MALRCPGGKLAELFNEFQMSTALVDATSIWHRLLEVAASQGQCQPSALKRLLQAQNKWPPAQVDGVEVGSAPTLR
eukprot:14226974-Alexandrium_andersonii.AAC.1